MGNRVRVSKQHLQEKEGFVADRLEGCQVRRHKGSNMLLLQGQGSTAWITVPLFLPFLFAHNSPAAGALSAGCYQGWDGNCKNVLCFMSKGNKGSKLCALDVQIPCCSSSSYGLSLVSCWFSSTSILLEISLLDPNQKHSLLPALFFFQMWI